MFNADKIRELRLKANLTTYELSTRILVSQPTVVKWENRRTLPNADNLKALADFFGVSVDVFFEKRAPQSQSQNAVGE